MADISTAKRATQELSFRLKMRSNPGLSDSIESDAQRFYNFSLILLWFGQSRGKNMVYEYEEACSSMFSFTHTHTHTHIYRVWCSGDGRLDDFKMRTLGQIHMDIAAKRKPSKEADTNAVWKTYGDKYILAQIDCWSRTQPVAHFKVFKNYKNIKIK